MAESKFSTSRSVSTTDKQIFLVSIKRAVNNEAATNLIKSTLHSDGPFAWEEISAELKSSIIEATPGQIENLANHPDIVRVTPIEATTTEGDMQHDDDVTKRRYILHPINRRDIDQCRATRASLQERFQYQMEPQDFGTSGVTPWKLDPTRDERLEGVKSMVPLDEYRPKNREAVVQKENRMIKPVGIDDQGQCKTIENALKDLFGDHISTKLLRDGRICHWRALLSSEEVAQAKAIQGVLSVHTVSLGRRGPGPGPHPKNVCIHR
ncbi:hypothetical protein FOBRF1_012694 [Fusarium oxysporum]